MSKKVEGNKKEFVNSYKTVNENISALDRESNKAVTSQSTVGTRANLKKQNDSNNLVNALIQIMYKRGEINSATYEKAIEKLMREVKKHEKRK